MMGLVTVNAVIPSGEAYVEPASGRHRMTGTVVRLEVIRSEESPSLA